MGHFSLRFWLRDVCEAALICANALRGTFHFWQPRGLRNMVLPAGFVASPRRTACLARRSSGKIIRAAACLELVAKLGGRPPPTGWCVDRILKCCPPCRRVFKDHRPPSALRSGSKLTVGQLSVMTARPLRLRTEAGSPHCEEDR